MYDVAIIGCGIVGAATAYELSKYQLKVAVFEAEDDVSLGATKANSAIVHGGFDPKPGTLMAQLNVAGTKQMPQLCKDLSVPYKRNGSLVVAFTPEEMEEVHTLYDQGVKNGVTDLAILSKEEVLAKEPQLSKKVLGALSCPDSGIVDPWELCLALAETAVENGVELHLNAAVEDINKVAQTYQIQTQQGQFTAKYVFNAAGVHSDKIHNKVAAENFEVKPTRGEYYVLDKSEGDCVSATIFQAPSAVGKGVLVSPTVHGNLIVGPNAQELPVKELDTGADTANTVSGLAYVGKTAKKSLPDLNLRNSIRNFSGIRANTDQSDFVIQVVAAGFIDLAGIKSPGLSSAPAIAQYGIHLLMENTAQQFHLKDHFINKREKVVFKELTITEKNQLIQKDPDYGHVICRCETITEGEIRQACHGPIPPVSIDGIKRRCNAGMGRCQGGFCGPRVLEIIAEESHRSPLEILQDRLGSNVLAQETKGGKVHV